MIQGCMSSLHEATLIVLTSDERAELEGLARSTKTEHRTRFKARIVLMAPCRSCSPPPGRSRASPPRPPSKWRVRYAKDRLGVSCSGGQRLRRSPDRVRRTASSSRVGYTRATRLAGHRAAVGQLEIALGPFERGFSSTASTMALSGGAM
jgi:hypothetical protein